MGIIAQEMTQRTTLGWSCRERRGENATKAFRRLDDRRKGAWFLLGRSYGCMHRGTAIDEIKAAGGAPHLVAAQLAVLSKLGRKEDARSACVLCLPGSVPYTICFRATFFSYANLCQRPWSSVSVHFRGGVPVIVFAHLEARRPHVSAAPLRLAISGVL